MGSHTMHKPTIVIHGATSFTAAPMLKYLEEHEDRDAFEFILAGRNKAKLDGLNVKLKQPREVVAVDLRDDEEVRDLVSKADVVLNLAGVSFPCPRFPPNNTDELQGHSDGIMPRR